MTEIANWVLLLHVAATLAMVGLIWWIRTAAWSARGLLVLWMVGQVIFSVATNPKSAELTQIARP